MDAPDFRLEMDCVAVTWPGLRLITGTNPKLSSWCEQQRSCFKSTDLLSHVWDVKSQIFQNSVSLLFCPPSFCLFSCVSLPPPAPSSLSPSLSLCTAADQQLMKLKPLPLLFPPPQTRTQSDVFVSNLSCSSCFSPIRLSNSTKWSVRQQNDGKIFETSTNSSQVQCVVERVQFMHWIPLHQWFYMLTLRYLVLYFHII